MSGVVRMEVRVNRFGDLADIDWTPAYARMTVYLDREMSRMFETVGASRDHKWPELAPSTLIKKAKAGKSTEILQQDGLLRASFHALRLDNDGLDYGTRDPKAKYHDSDKPRIQKASGGPRLPQRKLIRPLQRDADQWGGLVREHIETTSRGGGLP